MSARKKARVRNSWWTPTWQTCETVKFVVLSQGFQRLWFGIIGIFVRLLDSFLHCETTSSSVARGSKLSSYGATSASSPTSPKKKLCSKSLSKELDDKFDGKKHPYNAMFGSLFSTLHYTLRGDGWDFYVTSKIHVVRDKTASMKFAGFSFANWVMADVFNAVFGHIFLGRVSICRSNLSLFI